MEERKVPGLEGREERGTVGGIEDSRVHNRVEKWMIGHGRPCITGQRKTM